MTIYRVRAVTSGWVGAPGLTTFYFQTVADPSFSSQEGAQALAARVRLYFEGAKGLCPSSWVAQVSGVVDMLSEATGELTTSWAIVPPLFTIGTGAVGYLPLATALNLALNTDSVVAGHRVRGRSFFGPVGGVGENDGSPAAEAIASLQNAAQSLTSQVDGFGALVVWSRPKKARAATATSPAVPARAGTAKQVTSHQVKDKFAVLRSRRD